MNEKDKTQIERISELFGKMTDEQKAVFVAYGDGLLTAAELLAASA